MSDYSDLTKMDSTQLAQEAAGDNTINTHAHFPEVEPATPAQAPKLSPTWEQVNPEAEPTAPKGDMGQPEAEPTSPFQVTQPPQVPTFVPPTPQAMPAAPAMPTAAAPTPAQPGLKPLDLRPSEATRMELAKRQYEKTADTKLSGWDDFVLGVGHGVVNVGSEARSLMDFLTGHTTPAKDDWQNQYEAGIPKESQESGYFKGGDVAGSIAGYAPIPLAAGAIAAGAGLALPATAGVAAATGALEGAGLGAAGAAHEASKKGARAKGGDVAMGAAIGGGLGAVGGIAGVAATKGLKYLGGVAKDVYKKAKFADAQKFFDDIQGEIIKGEQAQIANAQAVLQEAVAPATAIAKKQMEDLGAILQGKPIGKQLADYPLKRNAQGKMMPLPKEFKSKAIKPSAAPEPKPQVRGVRKGLGYQRAYDGVPLEQVLPQLPEAIAKPFAVAVKEIAEAKIMLEHYKNQMVAYAENAIRLASEPADLARITKEVQEHGELRSSATDTLSKVRAYLFGEMQKLQAMTHPMAGLELSTMKHVHVDADGTQLKTTLDPLKKTFVGAAKQAENAKAHVEGAERYLDSVRERHQGLFEQVDTHLGVPTSVRVFAGVQKFGNSQTVVSIGQQFNPTRAKLAGRWLAQYNKIKAGIEFVDRNWKETVTYNVALKGRVPGAEKLLHDAGLIHPAAKSILLAGAFGYDTLNSSPAMAATGEDKIEKQQMGIGPAMVGVLLAQKYGPAGARQIARSGRFIFHFLYEDTQKLAGMADQMLSNFRGEAMHELDSLANAMNEYRGKMMQMQFVCPDAHGVMSKVLAGEATEDELKLVTPQGIQFAEECAAMKKELGRFAEQYVKEFDEGFHKLSQQDQIGAMEIRHAIHLAKDVLNPKSKTNSAGDWALQELFARSAAFNFTLNWKIATSAWLHDVAAYGGMQVGTPSVYAAYAQMTASPTLRGLVGRLHIGGAASEAAQNLNKAHKGYLVEKVQNQLVFLASLNRQYRNLAPEQIRHLGVTSANDFAEKVMTNRLPQQSLARIYEEAALDVSRTTGADAAGLNKTGMERAFLLGNISKYTRQPMIEQKLVMDNLKAAVGHFTKGQTALGLQRIGRLAHSLGVKAQYVGARGVLPVTIYAALVNNPYTSAATAEVAKRIDDLSLGLKVFGNLGEHGRWDGVISPLMGQRLPGFDDGIEAFKQVMELQGDINKMAAVVMSDDPGALFAGSKENEDVKKGQKALSSLITNVGYLFPKIGAIPTRFVRDAQKALPDFMNREFSVGVPSPWPIGEKTKPAYPTKLFGYAALPNQTDEQADTEAMIDAAGEFLARKPGTRTRAYEQATYAKNANSHTDADVPDPEEVAGLSAK